MIDLIKESTEIVNGRNDIYGSIQDRSDKYICSGLELKMERMIDVINNFRNKKELSESNRDTIIDLGAYLIEFSRRIGKIE
jgi:hypothetical protein